jgi:acyl-[acyl-carrier protein] desaturase
VRKAAKMAEAGIYDLRIHHDDIIWPLLRHWRVFERTGFDPAAEHARETLARFLGKLDASAKRYEERRATRQDQALPR